MDDSSNVAQESDNSINGEKKILEQIKKMNNENEDELDLRKGFYIKKHTKKEKEEEEEKNDTKEIQNNSKKDSLKDEEDFDYLKSLKIRNRENYDEEEERHRKYSSKKKIIRLKIINPHRNNNNNNSSDFSRNKNNSSVKQRNVNKDSFIPNRKGKAIKTFKKKLSVNADDYYYFNKIKIEKPIYYRKGKLYY